MLRVEYDTPYVRNLPIRLYISQANGRGGVVERAELPGWGDPFVAEWQAFYANVVERRAPKTSPAALQEGSAAHETFDILVFFAPLYLEPLLLATNVSLPPKTAFCLYLDHCPIEQVPLVARQMFRSSLYPQK